MKQRIIQQCRHHKLALDSGAEREPARTGLSPVGSPAYAVWGAHPVRTGLGRFVNV